MCLPIPRASCVWNRRQSRRRALAGRFLLPTRLGQSMRSAPGAFADLSFSGRTISAEGRKICAGTDPRSGRRPTNSGRRSWDGCCLLDNVADFPFLSSASVPRRHSAELLTSKMITNILISMAIPEELEPPTPCLEGSGYWCKWLFYNDKCFTIAS